MTVLTTDAVGERHRYLARNRPGWERSMQSIQSEGGPWACPSCDAPSFLCYRCSICGRDLASSDSGTAGRDRR